MNTDAMRDSARVVVSGLRHDGILPGGKEEMWRDLHLLSGAHLKGAAWGNTLTVEGAPIEVDSAVYVRGAIKIKASSKEDADSGVVNFASTVTSPDSIAIEDNPFRVRFMSSVYTGVAGLNNCIVYGNLYARRCTLRNSIVLGGVYCQGPLQIENSLVSTFKAKRVTIGHGVTLLLPAAIAEESMHLDHPVRALPFFDLSGASQETSSARGGVVWMWISETSMPRAGIWRGTAPPDLGMSYPSSSVFWMPRAACNYPAATSDFSSAWRLAGISICLFAMPFWPCQVPA